MTTSEIITRHALALLERGGGAAVSMRRLARAVRLTPMAIYHHFPNRDALLQTVVDREFARLQERILREARRGSHATILLHSLDTYIGYAFAHPRIFDYVFTGARPGARRYPADFRARRSPTLNLLADLVTRAMDDGYLEKADPWEIALELWAHVHGYVMLYRGGRFSLGEKAFTQLVHRSLKRLLHGLKKS